MTITLDQFRDVDLVINKVNDNFMPKQFVSEGDFNGRTLTVQLTNGGVIGKVPGAQLALRWRNKASGLTDLSAFELIDADNSIFRITYPDHMLNAGTVEANIMITHDGKTVMTKAFEIRVRRLAGELKGIINKQEFSYITAVLTDANKFRTDISQLELGKADKKELEDLENKKADLKYVEDQLSKIGTGVPKEIFASLAALKNKYPNGSKGVMLVMEPDGKTGYVYSWNGTAWLKGPLYQAQGILDQSVSERKIAKKAITPSRTDFFSETENLFDGTFVNASIKGDITVGGVFDKSVNTNVRSFIIEVNPNEKYTVISDQSLGANNRFRLALTESYPNFGDEVYYIKDEFVEDLKWSKSENVKYYTFTVESGYHYLIGYMTQDNFLKDVQIIRGEIEQFDGFVPYKIKNTKLVDLVDEKENPIFIKGKNLFDGNYVDGYTVSGNEKSDGGFGSRDGGVIYSVRVTPGKTYTITKEASDRFRIGLKKTNPNLDGKVYIYYGEPSENIYPKTITIPDDYNYMYVYVSISGQHPFVQIEEGRHETYWESHGYKFNEEAKKYGSNNDTSDPMMTPEKFGAMGNANYIHTDGTVWTSSDMQTEATDDSDAIQSFLNQGGNLIFEGSKRYLITKPVVINPNNVKSIDGGGTTLIVKGDIEGLKVIGTLSGSANPSQSGEKAFYEFGLKIKNLNVYGSKKNEGIGLVIQKSFGTIIESCSFLFLKRGIAIRGMNRNLILANSHIYAISEWGMHFEETCNLHQMNIVGTHISYSQKNIFAQEASLYNIQISGCDIETSSYPSNADCDIHFLGIETGIYEDIEITGCTLEDHWNTKQMVVFEGKDAGTNTAITIVGNVIGNSKEDAIVIDGTTGISIDSNSFKNCVGHDIVIKNHVSTIAINGNTTFSTRRSYGGFIKSEGEFERKYLSIIGNSLRDDGSSEITIKNGSLEDSIIANNIVKKLSIEAEKENCLIQNPL